MLKAWRRLALTSHPDKDGSQQKMQDLNEAKERCLEQIVEGDYFLSEREFALHICRVLDRKMASAGITGLNLEENNGARIVACELRKFYWIRAVDAMNWVLRCGMGEMAFDQEIEDEIPILCKFYNEFIGRDRWGEDDHTIMTVLNKYDDFKAGRYGNFACFVQD